MQKQWNRRTVLGAGLGLGATLGPGPLWPLCAIAGETTGAVLGDPRPFSFDLLKSQAKSIAQSPWVEALPAARQTLDRIDFDSHQQIRFRPEASLRLGATHPVTIQLFHPGKWFMNPVAIHILENGSARPVRFSPALFDSPADHPARQLPAETGFAGFRVMAPDLKTDWLAFLGASYFRAAAPFNQYGLSARGLAIDTALPPGQEEFPRFTQLWLEAGPSGPASLTIYALLDSPAVSGAYKIAVSQPGDTGGPRPAVMDVELELHPRRDIVRAGIAPFSSMFWYGEGNRNRAIDWRPELHDSDGLAILTGSGERIWRPLNNPAHPDRPATSSFLDRDPKGFGLLQRDRDFASYLDDSLFYERRPSVWVEPQGSWGEGAVQLVEIHTDDEATDNIVAFWTPKDGLRAGQPASFRYRLSWLADIPFPENLGRAIASWQGVGGDPATWDRRPVNVRRFVTDWHGPVFAGLTRSQSIEAVVTASRGRVLKAFAHEIVGQHQRWRSVIDIEVSGPEPVDIRAYLRRANTALTETWIGQYFPEG